MRIDKDYTIEKDSLQFILKYEHKTGELNKKGEEIVSRSQTYHKSLKDALRSYVNKVADPSQSSLDILSQLERIELTIKNLNL